MKLQSVKYQVSGSKCQVSRRLVHLTPDTPKPDTRERGQALVETALFSVLAILLAFGALTLIPIHRTRTAATSAAYACAQFVSQSPNPNLAVSQAELVAWKTLNADWSATLGAVYQVQALAPIGPGSPTGCAVLYQPPLPFNGLLGLEADWATVTFFSQSETWKARWR